MPSRNISLILRAVGARQAAREITQVNRATSLLGTSAGRVTRILSGTALGIGVVTAQAAKMGLQFDATMETQTLAFTQFLGGTRKATKYLDKLYELAAKTPFEFKDVVQGTRTLLAYGQNANQAYKTMVLLGDALGAAGGGVEQINRATVAMGQIQAAGVLHAQDLNQLVAAGVTSVPKLAAQMGISALKFRKQMQLGKIDSEKFFKAQQEVWKTDPIYQGMAAKQAKTYVGMLSTLHDYTIQTLGSMTKGLFNELKENVLPDMIDLVGWLGFYWKQDKLTLAEKIDITRTQVADALKPYVDRVKAWFEREDVARKIGDAISGAFRKALVFAAENAPKNAAKLAKEYANAFGSAGLLGKAGLVGGAGLLINKLSGGALGRAGRGTAGKLGKYGGVTPVYVVNMGGGMGGGMPGKDGLFKRGAKSLGPAIAAAAATTAGTVALGVAASAAAPAFLALWAQHDRKSTNVPGPSNTTRDLYLDKDGFSVAPGTPGARRVPKGSKIGGRHTYDPELSRHKRTADYSDYKGLPSWLTSGGKPPDVHTSVHIDGKKVAEAVHRAVIKKTSLR